MIRLYADDQEIPISAYLAEFARQFIRQVFDLTSHTRGTT
ncbi:hypothetical protein SEA_EAGLEPRIDE_63 [Mycobacterium phage Eaglepride]|nr:hypothetical protein SEA_EAGLEPRIDE_63 [Mycobacterium phage Eaglepride]